MQEASVGTAPPIPSFVDSPDQLRELVQRLGSCTRVAIDIESNGYYNYHEKTCVLTLSTDHEHVVIDTLAVWNDMGIMRDVLSRSEMTVFVHGGSYDVSSLKRDFGFEFPRILDTMLAGQLLGKEHIGLASLALEYMGVDLPKELQRHNWAERPMTQEQIRYAIGDTAYLFRIHDLLEAQIVEKDLVEEYAIECQLLSEQAGVDRTVFDAEGFRKIKGCSKLSRVERGILRALYFLREEIAAEWDVATFRCLGNHVLLNLATNRPRDLADLVSRRGLSHELRTRYAGHILEAISNGARTPVDRYPEHRAEASPRPTDEQRDLERALKDWRTFEAERRGIGPQGVLPTSSLRIIIASLPRSIEDIAAIERMGRHRTELYGAQLVDIINQVVPA